MKCKTSLEVAQQATKARHRVSSRGAVPQFYMSHNVSVTSQSVIFR